MKVIQLLLLCFICAANSHGQRVSVEITKEKNPKKLYTKVEIKDTFPGGDSLWIQSLEKQLDQSLRAKKRLKKGRYIVSVVFIIAKDGNLSDIRCETDPGFGLCDEVVRVIKKSPRWIPGKPNF